MSFFLPPAAPESVVHQGWHTKAALCTGGQSAAADCRGRRGDRSPVLLILNMYETPVRGSLGDLSRRSFPAKTEGGNPENSEFLAGPTPDAISILTKRTHFGSGHRGDYKTPVTP